MKTFEIEFLEIQLANLRRDFTAARRATAPAGLCIRIALQIRSIETQLAREYIERNQLSFAA